MAPVVLTEEGISSSAASTSSAYSLQVILGCVIPFVAVASTIPIIMIRRHFATKHVLQRSKAQDFTSTPRTHATPRLPINSVYIARVDYYLPPSDTVVTRSVAETHADESTVSLALDGSVSIQPPSPELVPQAPPMVSLPSLSSMLCEFTAYADAIEPEYLTEARRSSTCLLDSVFSSKDIKALSFSELPAIPTVAPIEISTISVMPEDMNNTCETLDCEERYADKENSCTISRTSKMDSNVLFYEEEPTMIEENSTSIDPLYMYTATSEDNVEEISTSCLVPATTTWSIILDSSSTLASILAVRLSQFPPVPALPVFPLIRSPAASIAAEQSESSLGSVFTRSLSAPASLNILLGIQLEDALPRSRAYGPYLLDWPSFSNPGELWDEEDDLLFSVCGPQRSIILSKPNRHTWAGGVVQSRSQKGELWDDEDDRRFSLAEDIKISETFASSSILHTQMSADCVMAKSTLDTSDSGSLADHTYEDDAVSEEAADQTLCCSESDLNYNDSGFPEVLPSCCFDFGSNSVKEQNIKVKSSCEELESGVWSSAPPYLCHFAFEDPDVDATPIHRSESSRSSLMSLASVLDSTIRIVNPIHPYIREHAYERENLEKTFEVVDMELEPGFSYSSRIVSVNYPLVREISCF